MAKGQPTLNEAKRKLEIERAAQTLRSRLAFATIKANGNGSLTVQSLKEVCPSSPSPFSYPSDSPSTASTSPMLGNDCNVGLGLGFEAILEEPVKGRPSATSLEASTPAHPKGAPSPQTVAKHKKTDPATPTEGAITQPASSKEPSLYDAIFGPAYTRMVQRNTSVKAPITPPPPAKHSNPSPPMRRSPHVRRGSSAHLEKLAASPRLPSSPNWHQLAQRRLSHNTGGGSSTLFNESHQSSPSSSSSFAPPIGSPSQQSRKSIGGSVHHQAHFGTPSRQRMRSAGGSLLPNGHPASSLAQDLGLASGSTPRSRTASSNVQFLLHDRHDDHDQAETDRVAGLLSSMLGSDKGTQSPRRSSFADPNIVTPRKRRRLESGGDDGNEAAAHSLLDLAASPSPSPGRGRHLERFPGATPSIGRLFEHHLETSLDASISRPSIDGQSRFAGGRAGWGPSSPQLDSSTPPKPIKQMTSPPITPPRSERRPQDSTSLAAGGADWTDDSSPCPSTPSRRGRMVLMSDEDDGDVTMNHDRTPPRSIKTEELTSLTETPRTPPPLYTPVTPKAPGSNFSYGEFLHVSPSPQPRMRMHSSNGAAHTPRSNRLQDTPTGGIKSQARFMDYGGLDMSLETPLTDLEMSDVLTPGKLHHGLLESSPRIGGVGVKKSKLLAD